MAGMVFSDGFCLGINFGSFSFSYSIFIIPEIWNFVKFSQLREFAASQLRSSGDSQLCSSGNSQIRSSVDSQPRKWVRSAQLLRSLCIGKLDGAVYIGCTLVENGGREIKFDKM